MGRTPTAPWSFHESSRSDYGDVRKRCLLQCVSMPSGRDYAVVLAGGGGTRLWPSSRRARPKQLLTLGGSESLLAAAVRRAQAVVGLERTLVVTAADQEAQIRAAV